jgi:hypothetical protein
MWEFAVYMGYMVPTNWYILELFRSIYKKYIFLLTNYPVPLQVCRIRKVIVIGGRVAINLSLLGKHHALVWRKPIGK